MLALAKQAGLGAGQHKREAVDHLWGHKCVNGRPKNIRKRRVAVISECLGPKFDFARGRGKAPQVSSFIQTPMLRVNSRQLPTQSGRFGPKLLEGNAAGFKLLAMGGIDIPVPELFTKTEPSGQIKDDLRVGAGLIGGRDDRRPKLNARLCLLTYLESNLQRFAFEA